MKKIYLISLGIVLIVINILFFIIPFPNKNLTHWISYASVMVAIVSQIVFLELGRKSKASIIYGYPILKLGLVFLLITIISAVILILINSLKSISYLIPVIINTLIFGSVSLILVVKAKASSIIEKIDVETQKNQQFRNDMIIKITSILNRNNKNIKRKLEELIEQVKFIDPISSVSTREIEKTILERVDQLEKGIQDLIEESKLYEMFLEISNLLKVRNEMCIRGK